MFRCEICGAVMEDRPKRRVCNLQPDGVSEMGFDESCPYCESPYIAPYDPYETEDEANE